jgi:hypothetical protein
MPIGFVVSCERPANSVPMQAGFDVDIVANVTVVVVVDEGMMTHGVIKRESSDYEKKAQDEGLPPRGEGQSGAFPVFFWGRQQMNLTTPSRAGGIPRKARASNN